MKHALAFVKYKYYKTTQENKEKYGPAYWYKSDQKRLLDLVGEGGTLWVVTSLKKDGKSIYSLAYRLENCSPLTVSGTVKDEFGKYGVMADFKNMTHFGLNEMNKILMSLKFKTNNPIKSEAKIGQSIQTIRELSEEDIITLNRYAERLISGRNIFISYSSKDGKQADQLASKLLDKEHTVWLDRQSIISGEFWESSIKSGLQNAHTMIVIVSENSAKSKWVNKESKFAIERYKKVNGFARIIPIVIDEAAWKVFGHLHKLHALKLKNYASINELMDNLIKDFKKDNRTKKGEKVQSKRTLTFQ